MHGSYCGDVRPHVAGVMGRDDVVRRRNPNGDGSTMVELQVRVPKETDRNDMSKPEPPVRHDCARPFGVDGLEKG